MSTSTNPNGRSPIQVGPVSQTPAAVYQRVRYLTDDDYCDKKNEAKRRRRALEKQERLNQRRSIVMVPGPGQVKRVEFHLSRGRDAGYIAVAESLKVSRVLEIIRLIQASK